MPILDTASKRRTQNRYLLVLAILVLLVLIAYLLGLLSGKRGTISGTKLRCVVSQDVTPFDDRILYYDNSTLFCLAANGSELWKASVGENAKFSAGEKQVVVWSGNQLLLYDRNGRSTYSDRLSEPIQFARVGTKYLAVVTGDGVSPTLTVKENIAFSEQIDKKRRIINWKEIEETSKRALGILGVDIDLNAKLGSLSTAKQQLVAIARALVYDAKLLVMDEPTSALSSGEVQHLFKIMNDLKARGLGIIFISHKLDELFAICDRMSVIRDGHYIGMRNNGETTTGEIIAMMVGREIVEEHVGGTNIGDVILEVKNISKRGNYDDVSFTLRKGEVLGITGLVGAGRTETVRALFGLNPPESGEMFLEGKKIAPKSPAEAQELGLKIVGHLRAATDKYTEDEHMNWSTFGTPAESTAGQFQRSNRKNYGVIEGVTDRAYMTNSSHVPVYYPIKAIDKIRIEAPYHALENAGHIAYIEMDGDPTKNVKAFESVVRAMHDADMGYFSINHPVDRDPVCGYTGLIENECPHCHRKEVEKGRFTVKRMK